VRATCPWGATVARKAGHVPSGVLPQVGNCAPNMRYDKFRLQKLIYVLKQHTYNYSSKQKTLVTGHHFSELPPFPEARRALPAAPGRALEGFRGTRQGDIRGNSASGIRDRRATDQQLPRIDANGTQPAGGRASSRRPAQRGSSRARAQRQPDREDPDGMALGS